MKANTFKWAETRRYHALSVFLRESFGCRVRKVPVNSGFGCAHRRKTGGCIFCNEASYSPVAGKSALSVEEQLRRGIAATSGRADKFIAYFQPGTNTCVSPEKLERTLAEAAAHEDVVGLAIGTRPDCVPEEILQTVEQFANKMMVLMEYGVQSAHDQTLERINRGHRFGDFVDAARRTRRRGILVCAHLIFGLPGETRDMMLDTVGAVASAGVDGVKFHHLQVCRDTVLEKEYRAGEIKTLTSEEYVPLVADALELLPPDVVVHRLCGEVLGDLLLAPVWDVGHGEIVQLVEKELRRRGSRQGLINAK